MALAVPALALGAWRGRDRVGAAALAAALAAWASVWAARPVANPIVAAGLADNAATFFGGTRLVAAYPALAAGLAAAAGLACGMPPRCGRKAAWAMTAAAAFAAWEMAGSLDAAWFDPHLNYGARTALALALPLAGLCAALAPGMGPPRALAAAALSLAVAAQAVTQAQFSGFWREWAALVAEDAARPGGAASVAWPETAAARLPAGDPARRFAWPWVAPYQGMELPLPGGAGRRRAVLVDGETLNPFLCSEAPLLSRPPSLPADAWAAALGGLCAKALPR
jgi:hypothetical protein